MTATKNSSKPPHLGSSDSRQRDFKGRLIVAVFRLFGCLPLAFARRLGVALGALVWITNSQPARVTRDNISFAYPDMPPADQQRLAKASLRQSGQTAMELGRVWFADDQWLLGAIVERVNEDLFQSAVNDQRGLILLSPHIGNWEVLGRFLGLLAPGITVMYQPAQLPSVDAMIRKARLRNMNVAATDRSGVAALMKALKQGRVIGILPDQVPVEGGGVFVDLFGKPALTMTMIGQLQKKTGAHVLMVHSERVPGGFRVVFNRPHPQLFDEQLEASARGLNLSVEACINQCPDQYQWQYKRYRRQPPGEERPYQY